MLSLYIHVPFCVKKCHYCGFYSTAYHERLADRYLDALSREIDLYRGSLFMNRPVDTIYLGGGTPTALNERQLARLLLLVQDKVPAAEGREFTIEANPGTVTDRSLALIHDLGVNRISIGVQSFSDEVLRQLGRIHSAEQAAACIAMARRGGFENIGIDLIYGVPRMTAGSWRSTLEQAVRTDVEHLSAYCLSPDDGSRLAADVASGKASLPADDSAAEQHDMTVDIFGQAGFGQYEISNFAKSARACRHNSNYWDRGEYAGLGPGAWSFVGGRRYANIPDVAGYADRILSGRSPVGTGEIPTPDQAAAETIMLGLRRVAGIDLDRFARDHGREERDELLGRSRDLERNGLLFREQGRLALTRKGMALLNEVLARLTA